MRILGLDTALASMGYAVLFWDEQGTELLEYDVFTTPAKTDEGDRLHAIRLWLQSFLSVRQPVWSAK